MSEWISVRERLPEESQGYSCCDFLVVVKTHGGILPNGYISVHKAQFMPARPKDDEAFWPGNTAYWEIFEAEMTTPFEVTHWMPLPEPPKAEI